MILAYDTALLESWDRTAPVLSSIHNLTCIVVNAASGGKSKMRVRPPSDFHPYRIKHRPGLKITAENAKSTLWMLGNAIMGNH